jgi:hypothetical protein
MTAGARSSGTPAAWSLSALLKLLARHASGVPASDKLSRLKTWSMRPIGRRPLALDFEI